MSPKRTQDVREERGREHKIYKIAQFRFNQISTSIKNSSAKTTQQNNSQPGENIDKNKLLTDLQIFKELRALAALEIRLRREFNEKYFGGAHQGIQEQVKQREALLPGLQAEITSLKQELGYYQIGPIDAPGGLARHPDDPTDEEEESAMLQFLESTADSIPFDPETRRESTRNDLFDDELEHSQSLSLQNSRTASDVLDDEELAEITRNVYDPKFNDSSESLSQQEIRPGKTWNDLKEDIIQEERREREEEFRREQLYDSPAATQESTVSEPSKPRYTTATWLSDEDLEWLRSSARGKRPERRGDPE